MINVEYATTIYYGKMSTLFDPLIKFVLSEKLILMKKVLLDYFPNDNFLLTKLRVLCDCSCIHSYFNGS